jgi:alpha-L-rhamnosidase
MPHPGGGFKTIGADLQTYYGLVSSHWKQDNGQLQMDVEIPANTNAIIFIPANYKNFTLKLTLAPAI